MSVTDSNQTEFIQNELNMSNRRPNFFRSMIFRFFSLLLLLLLCQIPVSMIKTFINSQSQNTQQKDTKLANNWGNKQTIIGPLLSIPYVERISRIESQTDSKGTTSSVSRDVFNNKTLMLLPENLRISADIKDKTLSKEESSHQVYEANVEITGNFDLSSLPEDGGYNTIEWEKAFLSIGLNDNKSVQSSSPLRWEDGSTAFNPGTKLPHLLENGFHANLENVATDNKSPQFKILLNLKGNQSFQFAPFGELTTAVITSNIDTLELLGGIAVSSKVVSDNEFSATWRISNLSRNYPQEWLIVNNDVKNNVENNTKLTYDFSSVLTGVEINNTQTDIAIKNDKIFKILEHVTPLLAVLFLCLYILEFKPTLSSKPTFLHYIIVALPILLTPFLFYALIEITSFIQAYQIVFGSSIVLIVLYILSALKSFGRAFLFLLILCILFATVYINIEMPEYSLMAMSAAGITLMLFLMMSATNLKEKY